VQLLAAPGTPGAFSSHNGGVTAIAWTLVELMAASLDQRLTRAGG
jgi:hypothetical protein